MLSLTGYYKRFYRIPLFTILLLFYLFYIYWDWQSQKCDLKCPKVFEINTELCVYCNFCLYPSLQYEHLYPHLTKIHLLQLKINNIWMEFFWNQKIFHLGIKEISTVKSCINYFNKLVLINKLIKLSADISDNSFLLDSLSKAKIYLNFSTGSGFLFFNRFWNIRFSDRCHFILTVFLLEKSQYSYFQFFCFTA